MKRKITAAPAVDENGKTHRAITYRISQFRADYLTFSPRRFASRRRLVTSVSSARALAAQLYDYFAPAPANHLSLVLRRFA